MIAELIRLLIAAACGLFVLSLPFSKTDAGKTLRRWAAERARGVRVSAPQARHSLAVAGGAAGSRTRPRR